MITYDNYKRASILSEMTGFALTGHFKLIKDIIVDHLTDLEEYVHLNYPDCIFFVDKNDNYVLRWDKKNYNLYVRNSLIWMKLNSELNMDDSDIESFIKCLVEDGLKLKPKSIRALRIV